MQVFLFHARHPNKSEMIRNMQDSYMSCPTEFWVLFLKRLTDADLTDTLYIGHKTL